MKLELKHLAGYLPYSLNCLVQGEGKKVFDMQGITDLTDVDLHEIGRTVSEQYDIEDVFPILRPLSDLDIHELRSNENYPDLEISQGSIDKLFKIEIGNDLQCFDISIFEYLFEKHFDIYGLIENGLAISIHDVEEAGI